MFNLNSPAMAWRSDSSKLSDAAMVLSDDRLLSMLAVVELESPQLNHKEPRDGFESTYILGRIDGFNAAMKVLRSLSDPLPPKPEPIVATWGPEQK